MEDFRKDEIIYENDWQRFDAPVVSKQKSEEDIVEKQDDESKNNKRKKKFPSLITIQLVVCLIIAFSVFMLKAMNSDTYERFCSWYNELMSETLLSNSTFEDIDLSRYFDKPTESLSATDDEV